MLFVMPMRFLRFAVLAVMLAAPFALQAQREKFPMEDLAVIKKQWPDALRTGSGLRTQVLVEGSGAVPQPGDVVAVRYKGWLLDGRVFDQNLQAPAPLEIRVGRRQVIAGWDEGLQLMKAGEKRLLIIPFELGYGTRGRPPVIPRSATLIFEVELVAVQVAGSGEDRK